MAVEAMRVADHDPYPQRAQVPRADERELEEARSLGVNVSAAAREGVAEAIRLAKLTQDRHAYQRHPETHDEFWDDAQVWSDGE